VALTLAFCGAASLFGSFVFSGGPAHTPWSRILEGALGAFAFSSCCALLTTYTLPVLMPHIRRRLPPWLAWVAGIAVLVAIAAIGSLLPMLAFAALGYIPAHSLFAAWVSPLEVSTFFTVLYGGSGIAIAELRARLDKTSLALRTKERDEAEARRLAAEAQLASLESRVDPHFFFNTLNSIAALVRHDPAAAERAIEQLAALMRSSLDRRASPLVPLDEELGLVRNYLEIEHVRFGPRLRYAIDGAGAPGTALVPRLSLQTLVENSVKYAVSPRREGAALRIAAAAPDGRVQLTVEDDGPGFDADSLPAGHGLDLLRSRLAMLFGADASLHFDARPGRTAVVITIPRRTAAAGSSGAPS
jgi:signal transduction histidine kinase